MKRAMSFADALAPVTVQEFICNNLEKKSLVLRRENKEFYSKLVTLEDIDRHLGYVGHKYPDVCVADALNDIPKSEYVLDGDRIDKTQVYRLFDQGATVVMRKMHHFIPALAQLVRSAEKTFGCEFQTNVYFTPAGAKQGFKIHYDTHDIFALQILGSKRWRIYGAPVELPFGGQDYHSASMDPGPKSEEFDLHAGDLYYIPRGLVHDCVTTGECSIHVTLGMLAHTWTELFIESLMNVCQQNPEFRRYLPVGAMAPGADRAALETIFQSLVTTFAAQAQLGPALEHFRDGFLNSRQADTTGRFTDLAHLDGLAPQSSVVSRPDLIYRLEQGEAQLHLHCHTNVISFPSAALPAVKFALETPRFTVGDIPGLADDASRIALVRRLTKEGLLTLSEPETRERTSA